MLLLTRAIRNKIFFERRMSIFAHVKEIPLDAGFKLNQRVQLDTFAQKVDLGLGAYRDDTGQPWLLPVVSRVEEEILKDKVNHEYLNIDGLPSFCKASLALLLGDSHPMTQNGCARNVQTLSGTGALRAGAAFLKKFLPLGTKAYMSDPTWNNHPQIFEDAGITCSTYRYWDNEMKCLDMSGMLEDLNSFPKGSIIVLHACAHNPTGMDPSVEQWDAILQAVQRQSHFVFFDLAYQGFATGDPDRDAFAVRYFVEKGQTVFVAQSFAKNFGLYSERIGCLSVVTESKDLSNNIVSQLNRIMRAMWSNPPAHGAHIVSRVLMHSNKEWRECLKVMSGRIALMRQKLYQGLVAKNTPGKWDHIVKQIGMFAYSGLLPHQVSILVEKYHVYLYANGRMSMAGLNSGNIDYVIDSIHKAVVESMDTTSNGC